MKNISTLRNPLQAAQEKINNFGLMLIDVGFNPNKQAIRGTVLVVEDKNVYPNDKNNMWEKFTINIPNTSEADTEKYKKLINQKVKINVTKSTFWGSGTYQDQLSCEGTITAISEGK